MKVYQKVAKENETEKYFIMTKAVPRSQIILKVVGDLKLVFVVMSKNQIKNVGPSKINPNHAYVVL